MCMYMCYVCMYMCYVCTCVCMYMCLYVHACGMCCKIWRGDYCLQSVVRSGGEITVYKVNVYIPNTGMKSLNPGTITVL